MDKTIATACKGRSDDPVLFSRCEWAHSSHTFLKKQKDFDDQICKSDLQIQARTDCSARGSTFQCCYFDHESRKGFSWRSCRLGHLIRAWLHRSLNMKREFERFGALAESEIIGMPCSTFRSFVTHSANPFFLDEQTSTLTRRASLGMWISCIVFICTKAPVGVSISCKRHEVAVFGKQ